MKNTLKIDFDNNIILMDRTFAKKAEDTNSNEYIRLQQVRKDYPNFKVMKRTIRKNPNKNVHKGLTYDYMVRFILEHETQEEAAEVLKEFKELRLISECHGRGLRYPTIKKWFLAAYPEVAQYGMMESTQEVPLREVA